ncbi:MAG: hypothetical protein HQL46_09865 [Gammaproteobacteria bacterium]|nr:hypothetical protein [Gammaproteobacteria bacterium]
MKYVFRHKAIIEHEIDAKNLEQAKEKLFSDVLECEGFFQNASNIITDERIDVLNSEGEMVDRFNIYD